MELAADRSLIVAVVSRVFTVACVADMLGEDEAWLQEISIELEPKDGVLLVFGLGDDGTTAFTDFGIESLQDIIREYDDNPDLQPQRPSPRRGLPQPRY